MARHYKKRKPKNLSYDKWVEKCEKEGMPMEDFSFKPESKWRMLFNILLVGAMVAFSILIWL